MFVKVSVHMVTYNHQPFIRQAIESVLSQKTNFNIELVIGEDFSTDGTREIVFEYAKKYPDQIIVITSDFNVGQKENDKRTIQSCNGEYIAICEGDDYWTDPYKLQKQVDFLDNNPDYGLVHSDVNHLYNKTGELIYAYNRTNKIEIPEGEIFDQLIHPSHIIKTMTVCFRKDLFQKYYLSNSDIMSSSWCLTDISIWLMLSLHSKIHYCNEVFATYRLSEESASRSTNPLKLYEFHMSIIEIRSFYCNRYVVNEDIKHKIRVQNYKVLLADSFSINDKRLAKSIYNKAKGERIKLPTKFHIYYIATQLKLIRKILLIVKYLLVR